MAISAATPMKTPSMVKAERIMLRQIACMAAAMIISAKAQKAYCCAVRRPASAAVNVDIGTPPVAGAAVFAGFGFCVVRDDLPVAHGQGAIGIGGDVGLVRDDDDGDALLAIELRQRLHDLVRGAGIEVAGRLVGEQQAGRVDQRARDRDALLLAARELARRVALAVAQARAA